MIENVDETTIGWDDLIDPLGERVGRGAIVVAVATGTIKVLYLNAQPGVTRGLPYEDDQLLPRLRYDTGGIVE